MLNIDDIIKYTKSMNLLYVEDDQDARESTLMILEEFFDHIDVAEDGKIALDMFIDNQENKYELILSDINMPHLDGLGLVKHIRQIDQFVPIILLTAQNETQYLLDSIELGIDGYLHKPLNMDKFLFYLKRITRSQEIKEIKKNEAEYLLNTIENNVIVSKTDLKGIIIYVSKAFCKISGYSKEELVGKPHNIVRHPDMPSELFGYIWSIIPQGETWDGEVLNLHKDGSSYWVHSTITPNYDHNGKHIGYTSIRRDIALQKEVEILNTSLEMKIEQRTEQIELEKKSIEQILSNITIPVLITSQARRVVVYANKFAQDLYEASQDEFIEAQLDTIYTLDNGPQRIIDQIKENGRVDSLEEKITTHNGKEFIGLLSVAPILYKDEECYIGMTVDITKQKETEKELISIHKHTRDSIEYASLIQGALIPDNHIFRKHFKDSFVHWMPKDIVGGDIYLFEELRDKNELLLMFIDCTGHGVPGAFVTMLVKAIERQIIAKIEHDKYHDINISPAWILAYFNKQMKKLLKQDNPDSLSNAGFDGGVIYYNRETQILKFAGAETPLFYIDTDGSLNIIKGDRYSVGYKKCDANYKYKDNILEVKPEMKFYCTTDGYLDQNGGSKDFPFGKKRFTQIIKESHNSPMSEQKKVFIEKMDSYESEIENNDRNDDMTLIAFQIGEAAKMDNIILEYDGVLTQGIISHSMDILEQNIHNIGLLGKVSTLTIELTQNMMNYSKSHDMGCRDIRPAGHIKVIETDSNGYKVSSKNIVSVEDKKRIEPKLLEIKSLDTAGIKKRYRELRKSGENTHEKGGGIGFYEIAKLTPNIEYEFKAINDEKYYFTFFGTVESKKRDKTID
ncbi:MAG: SiaB family protein kinase [Campylobacterota bacterium]|nr:SiaB family protein kinase [Campylobacterota bacterium]